MAGTATRGTTLSLRLLGGYMLDRLRIMVWLALQLAGPARRVSHLHADRAFQKLRCKVGEMDKKGEAKTMDLWCN